MVHHHPNNQTRHLEYQKPVIIGKMRSNGTWFFQDRRTFRESGISDTDARIRGMLFHHTQNNHIILNIGIGARLLQFALMGYILISDEMVENAPVLASTFITSLAYFIRRPVRTKVKCCMY